MASIDFTDVRKTFGKTEVVHGIDIEIRDGEFIVIVGPSGCGKSTLLRMVAGLETVTSGEIAIGGKRVNELEPMDRNIAMVFQNYALYPHMSVFDNMAYGLKIAGTPKPEIRERVASVARLLQLEEYLNRKPRQLSGGQRQRVAMGRAIVRKPQVFLFDEPLSNLDAKLRAQMRLEIKALQQDLGVTSLYVTHDQVEAMTLADRVIVMNAGNAEQIGKPLEVYARPATRFVAGFIGSPSMNFLSVRAFLSDDAFAQLPEPMAMRVRNPSERDALVVGVRPEHLVLCDPGKARFKGRLRHLEALGAETLLHLSLDGGEQLTIRHQGSLSSVSPGDQCFATCNDAYLCLFDPGGRCLVPT
ncbi:MAG TPA: sn-glycerol-3-phosphate ABC transporter ATP-binding protein UgpC [Geminicoccaceae bacterium]|nr:sn-glycerol-3-phosphate ABC transporter ATP-binding protein UgpC [Geminicoccaceae bacterium]